MCKILSAQAFDGNGKPWAEHPEAIEFDDWAGYDKTGLCTCWIAKPEGKELLDLFVEECIRPLLEQVSWGEIRIYVH